MNRKVLRSLSVIALLLFTLVLPSVSRPVTHASSPSPAAPAADVLSFLPASDAVTLVDVRRLLNETFPRVFAADSAKLAQINAELDKFKNRTGIDPRSFDRVAMGMRYTYPSPKVTKVETVAVAHGTFDAKALSNAGRIAASGKFREEKYRGSTIGIFTINDQMKLFGLWDVKVGELAACALDANTLAIGTLPNVRAAIDTGKSRGRANVELAALASRDPNAVIGFGANLTRALLDNINMGNDAIAKDAKSIRQVYGAMGTTQTEVSVSLVARTESPDAAKSLSETVLGLKQLGSILVMRMAPAKKALAQSALENLKITTRGNDLEISTQVSAASLASVIK